MPILNRPLDAHPAFVAKDFDSLAGILETQLSAQFTHLPRDGRSIDARANAARLPQSELWYCAYGMPLTVQFPDSDYVRLQMPHKSVGATWASNDQMTAISSSQACISTGKIEIDFAEDFEQIVWRLPKGKLEQKLALMTGRPIGYALEFPTTLDLATPQGATLSAIFNCLVQAVGATPTPMSNLVVAELEQAIIASFLATADHNCRGLLEGDAAKLAPWQVRRAENHIEANWDKPITIEDLAAVTGASSRSLFRTFKETRGCSPLDFVRRLRLTHAKRILERAADNITVTDVAFACGFGDLGRFSKDFLRSFGERPSDVLARKRGIVAAA